MKAKPKKWAAESLVSETESKATASPEQQKMAGELTAEMLLMMSPVPGGKKAVKLAKKLFKGKGKGKAGKVSDKKLLELYRKAHPGAKVSKNMISKKPAKISENMLSKKPAKTSDDVLRAYNKAHPGAKVSKNMISKKPAKTSDDVLRAYNKAHPGAKVSKKAKGGSVKKYSSGGGVRKARF